MVLLELPVDSCAFCIVPLAGLHGLLHHVSCDRAKVAVGKLGGSVLVVLLLLRDHSRHA